MRKEKDENRRLKNLHENKDDENSYMAQNYKSMEKELQLKRAECNKLQLTIEDLERANR